MRKLKLWTAVAAVVMLCALALPAAAFAEDGPTFASGEKFDLYTSSTIKDATDSNGMAKHMLDGDLSQMVRLVDENVSEIFKSPVEFRSKHQAVVAFTSVKEPPFEEFGPYLPPLAVI